MQEEKSPITSSGDAQRFPGHRGRLREAVEGACEDNYCRKAACGCRVAVIPIVVVLMTQPQELERRGEMAERGMREGGRERTGGLAYVD